MTITDPDKQEIYYHLEGARSKLYFLAPLIHCITHPIVINDCANAVLALGGRPIMA